MTSTSSGRPRPPKGAHILLVDRCLAPEIAREISKMDGIHGIALAEHYGDEVAHRLTDVTFLTEAGDHGWGVLTQNPRMWQVPDERTCIIEHRTRVFSLDDPNASKTLKGLVLGRHILSIRRRMRHRIPASGGCGCSTSARTSRSARGRATASHASRIVRRGISRLSAVDGSLNDHGVTRT